MRHGIRLGILGCLLLGVGSCAAGPPAKDAGNGPAEGCSVSSCFNQHDIRSYEVLGAHTVVVYTGRRRCPFLVTLRGPRCSMGIGPSLTFLSPRRENAAAAETIPRILSGAGPIAPGQQPGFGVPGQSRYGFGASTGRFFDKPSRICTLAPNTIAYTGAMPVGEQTPVGMIPGLSDACVLDQVHSLTDNQLIELLVKRKLAPPPPPVGQGSLSMPQTPPAGAGTAATGRANRGNQAAGQSASGSGREEGASGGAGGAPPPAR